MILRHKGEVVDGEERHASHVQAQNMANKRHDKRAQDAEGSSYYTFAIQCTDTTFHTTLDLFVPSQLQTQNCDFD
jgi:hypothetical protein